MTPLDSAIRIMSDQLSPAQIASVLRLKAAELSPSNRGRGLTGTQLGKELGHGRTYVWAMKLAGFEFDLGTRCTLGHARNWLALHPDFRTTQVVERPARSSGRRALQDSPAGKPGEPS